MVDLTPEADGRPRARLLDLVAGRSGKAYGDWLDARGPQFRDGVRIATLDPLHGYKNANDAHLEDTAVLDAFHILKLGTAAMDEVRRRAQQETLGCRGRKPTPSMGSGPSCGPARSASATASAPILSPPSTPTRRTRRSISPGRSPNACPPLAAPRTSPWAGI